MPAQPPLREFESPVFRAFEHGRLRVGDKIGKQIFSLKHFTSLVDLAEQTGHRYYKIGHRSVRFKHFVGILATPFLSVEILPKTDRKREQQNGRWQGVLVDMLRYCEFVRPESTGWSQLGLRSGTLLEWYVQAFFTELESLLRYGLVHQYQQQQANIGVLKGRLEFAQQIKYNLIRKDRFFVSFDHFTDRHPANLTIGAALLRLRGLPLPIQWKGRLRECLDLFPKPGRNWRFSTVQQKQILNDRKLAHYTQALIFAQHILQDEQTDIRSGEYRGLALLFDMNQLFEEYLYRQLLRWKPDGVQIERQQSRQFWGRNRLRPDLVIASSQGRMVLDTKWRLLNNHQPTAEELRQIYVYCDYFDAAQGILIFPQSGDEQEAKTQIFSPLPGGQTNQRSCRVHFAKVVNDEGYLNSELGKEIFNSLLEI